MGEAINLVNNFKVEKVIFNCGEFNELEQELIKALEKKKISYYSCIKELNIDDNKFQYYVKIAELNNLSIRQLRERIKSKEYERLPESTKEKLINHDEANVVDFVKNPIIIKNSSKYDIFSEKVLQKLILEDIENFLDELGNGFTFIKSEYPIKLDDRYNYIDLLLYNIKYKCYVVIELKVIELKKEHIGQIMTYMNYIDKNIKTIEENDTVGIIICKQDNKYVIKYCSDDRIIAREYVFVCYNEYGVGKMKIELDNFIIEYDKEISYMPNIISTLENNTIEILEFFELEKLSKKKRVVIYTDREKYRKHLLPFVKEFKEWMCADTYDGNINLLEISESRKSKEHEDMDLDEFVKCILHEFVHSCQQEWNANSNGTSWYWEALATNLSGQDYSSVSLDDCDFEKLKRDFNGTQNGYSYSYTLGKYMLENYSKDKLLEYVKNPDLLKKDADDIFQTVKQSQINKKL